MLLFLTEVWLLQRTLGVDHYFAHLNSDTADELLL